MFDKDLTQTSANLRGSLTGRRGAFSSDVVWPASAVGSSAFCDLPVRLRSTASAFLALPLLPDPTSWFTLQTSPSHVAL
jgi:hypothetical protein